MTVMLGAARGEAEARHAAGRVATTSRGWGPPIGSRTGYLSAPLIVRKKSQAGVTRACGVVMPGLVDLP